MNIQERDENGVTIFELEGRIDTEGAVDMDLALQSVQLVGAAATSGTVTVSERKRPARLNTAAGRFFTRFLGRFPAKRLSAKHAI